MQESRVQSLVWELRSHVVQQKKQNKQTKIFWILALARPALSEGPVVKTPPALAGDMGVIPDLGRFHMPRGNHAHTLQLLTPQATTAEADMLTACALRWVKPQQWETGTAIRVASLAAARGGLRAAMKTLHRQKEPGEGRKGKPLRCSCLKNLINSKKRQRITNKLIKNK